MATATTFDGRRLSTTKVVNRIRRDIFYVLAPSTLKAERTFSSRSQIMHHRVHRRTSLHRRTTVVRPVSLEVSTPPPWQHNRLRVASQGGFKRLSSHRTLWSTHTPAHPTFGPRSSTFGHTIVNSCFLVSAKELDTVCSSSDDAEHPVTHDDPGASRVGFPLSLAV